MKINNNLRTGGLYTKRPYMMQIEEKGKLDYITKFDYFLMGTVLMISLIGLVFLEGAMENMYLIICLGFSVGRFMRLML